MSGVNKDDLQTAKLRNHHVALTVWPQGGRILEVASLRTGNDLISWWPFKVDVPERAGGIGERTVPEGARPYALVEKPGVLVLTRALPDGLSLTKTISLPSDSLVFHVSLALRNDSDRFRAFTLDQTAGICPGSGGACPTAKSGISNCREKAFLRRCSEEAREISYEVFQALRVERDDVEWAVFTDPVSDNSLAVVLPEGHVVLRTEYHWWLEWSKEVHLAPGAEFRADFHYACAGHLRLPMIACEHFLAGFAGNLTTFGDTNGGAVHVYGLGPASAGNQIGVSLDGKEFASGKPLPDSREPLVIELPSRPAERDLEIEVSVGGKFGAGRISSGSVRGLYRELESLCKDAGAAAARGAISPAKRASILAQKRIVDLSRDKSVAELEAVLAGAVAGASAILASPLEAAPFYTAQELSARDRLSKSVDISAATQRARVALTRAYDLSIPRFRQVDPDVWALQHALLEAAIVLSVRHDDELIELFRARLAELRDLWARYGEVLYETIHHGVLLCHIIPCYKIAALKGILSAEDEIDMQAFIFDIAAKIRRQGGRQFRLSNWWAMEDAALAYVGALFPYLPDSRGYLDKARETLYWLLVHGTFADGGFWEMSISYHMLTLEYLWHIAEAFHIAGENLFNAEICRRRLPDMVEYFKRLAVPRGRMPAFDDGHRDYAPEVLVSLAKRLADGELAYHADAAFAREGRDRGVWDMYVPADTPDVTIPRRASEVLSASGRAVLRSFDRNITMVFDYGPHGGWHGHNDKLSFELFWRDFCLSPDAGSYLYEDALHWSWFKTAPAHNTVTIGDKDQLPCRGRLVDFSDGKGFVTAGMEAPTYPGVMHRREVTIIDRTIVIDDFVDGAPMGKTLVWRLNSYAPVTVSGGSAAFSREGVTVSVATSMAGAKMTVAEVPLIGENGGEHKGYVAGHQLRLSKAVESASERIQVRMDLAW